MVLKIGETLILEPKYGVEHEQYRTKIIEIEEGTKNMVSLKFLEIEKMIDNCLYDIVSSSNWSSVIKGCYQMYKMG